MLPTLDNVMFTKAQWNKVLRSRGIDPSSVPPPPEGFLPERNKDRPSKYSPEQQAVAVSAAFPPTTASALLTPAVPLPATQPTQEQVAVESSKLPLYFNRTDTDRGPIEPEFVACLALAECSAWRNTVEKTQYAIFCTLCYCGFEKSAKMDCVVSDPGSHAHSTVTSAASIARYLCKSLDILGRSRTFKVHSQTAPAEAILLNQTCIQDCVSVHDSTELRLFESISLAVNIMRERNMRVGDDVIDHIMHALQFEHKQTAILLAGVAALCIHRAYCALMSDTPPEKTSKTSNVRGVNELLRYNVARSVVFQALFQSLPPRSSTHATILALEIIYAACYSVLTHHWEVVTLSGWDPDDSLSLLDSYDPLDGTDFPEGE